MVTFANVHTYGRKVSENELYFQNHSLDWPLIYEASFIQFKKMPSLSEFKKAEESLRIFHMKYGQHHVKFNFPENHILTAELYMYLLFSGYGIGHMELYAIEPCNFPPASNDSQIVVEYVTKENFEAFSLLQYMIDLEFEAQFALQKREFYKEQLNDPKAKNLIAFYQGVPAGAATIFLEKHTAEINGLAVLNEYQRKGIATSLQAFVMNHNPSKTVILVADGQDTPREMYLKQNYRLIGFRFEALKVFEE